MTQDYGYKVLKDNLLIERYAILLGWKEHKKDFFQKFQKLTFVYIYNILISDLKSAGPLGPHFLIFNLAEFYFFAIIILLKT